MRTLLLLTSLVCLVGVAAAGDLGNQAPVKPAVPYTSPPADPNRQGGDTVYDAFPIASIVPEYHDTGTTAGYVNDYDAVCPYLGSTSPDVVYSYVAEVGVASVTVDLCYSSYDTKVYMYDASLNLLACNDDFYFAAPCYPYSSKIKDVPVTSGGTYYIIVDGYAGASGFYDIVVTVGVGPCDFVCPTPNTPESEPPLVDGYVDYFNAGCSAPPGGIPFRDLTYAYDPENPDAPDAWGNLTLCGGSGWYLSEAGFEYRDTDWYYIQMGPGLVIDITMDADHATYFFELGPPDCSSVTVIQSVIAGGCDENGMTITGYAEMEVVWFWVGPTTFSAPDGSHPCNYDYACWFTGLYSNQGIATETTSWGTMKALFE